MATVTFDVDKYVSCIDPNAPVVEAEVEHVAADLDS